MTGSGVARRAASCLVAFACVLALLIGPVLAPAQLSAAKAQTAGQATGQATGQTEAEQLPALVIIDSVAPLAPQPGETLTIRGRLVNTGDEPLERVRARLRVGDAPLGRTEIADYAARRKTRPMGLLAPGEAADSIVATELPPRHRVSFTLAVPLDDLAVREPGAYLLSVDVLATYPDGRRGRAGLRQTFFPWLPRPVQATRIVLLWPLLDVPKRDAKGIFLDDHLAAQLPADRPLGGLVAAAAGQQVTWAVDPELLETAADMADGYRVRVGREVRDGTGQAVAANWLGELREAMGMGEIVALGYADPDATALQHNHLSNDLIAATSLGRRVATEILEQSVTGDIAWPSGGFADPATLETLRTAGASAVVISSRQIPTTASFTPSGRATVRTLGGTLDGVVLDAGLSEAFAGPLNSPGATTLGLQRFLADTAAITAQRPDDARTLLVAPPRRWRPAPAVAARFVTSIEQAPWMNITPLSALRATRVPDVERLEEGYPRAAARAELSASYLRGVSRLRGDLLNFGAILTEPTRTTNAYDRAILRTESSAWRAQRSRARALHAAVRSQLDDVRSAVHVIVSPNATLASSSGVLPVTVANELDQPVRVRLRITSDNRARLTVTPPGLIEVAAETNQQVTVPVQAIANGVTIVRAQLATPDGDPYGPGVPLRVNATSIGTIGMFVTGGALAVLFLAASVRVVRRLRAARAAGEPRISA
jgi:hypothetical protein